MKINYCLVLSFVFLLSSINVMSQQTSHTRNLQAFVKDINAFGILHPQEKVYLHFDNNAYYAGETIWFKVYVVEAEDHACTDISKIVYVDLISPEGNLVETKKLKIENGRCHAEFSLNDSVVSLSKFSVKANEPIIVDLPLLGYRVFINLIDFSFREKSTYNAECHYKGAYYFKSYEKVDVKQIENREMAYLNSSKHFLSALYNDKLKENGYLSVRTVYNDSTRKMQFCYDDLNVYCRDKDVDGIQIQGQNKIRITLYYFANAKGKPVNLAETLNKRRTIDADLGDWMHTFSHYSKKLITVIYFLEDHCTIRSNGTIPDSNIKFFGAISNKRVGAKLPSDYKSEF